MKSAVPGIAHKARLLLQSGDRVTSGTRSIPGNAVAALNASASYVTFSPAVPAAKRPGAASAPSSATPAAANASGTATSKTPTAAAGPPSPGTPPAATASSGTSSSSSSNGNGGGSTGGHEGSDPGSSKRGGSGLLTTALVIGLPAGAYYAYEQSKQQYAKETGEPMPTLQNLVPPSLVPQSLGGFLQSAKQAVADVIPSNLSSMLGGAADKPQDKLHTQKQKDTESGFTILPPEDAAAAAAAAERDAAAVAPADAASTAAHDAMSAAADEFPGSSNPAAAAGPSTDARIQHVDMTPVHALFRELAGAPPADVDLRTTASSSSSSSGKKVSAPAVEADANKIVAAMSAVAAATSSKQEQQQQQQPVAPPAAAAAETPRAGPARSDAASVAIQEQSGSALEPICRQLGLTADLTPAGLVAAANAAGKGATSSNGTTVSPQVAQLNQAESDANLLGMVLHQLAALQAELEKELATAKQASAWAEEAAVKRETSLTEHFKELMREQSRIQQQITADAIRAAEVAVMADTAAAHNEERRQRGAVIDELRAKVNALSLAFEQRTAQVKSAHEVHKISLGVLALSKALEEGKPIGEQLQLLAAGCPGDPVVEAVAASLPPSVASSGLPTMQQLQQQFTVVAAAAAEAAYFSGEGEGGVLARLAAKLAVQLKVESTAADGSPDSKIAQAKMLVQQGRLLNAADAISAAAAGTQAAGIVASWVDNARARAAADQAVKLLQAHATTTATMAAAN